jgi:hypothetical protein
MHWRILWLDEPIHQETIDKGKSLGFNGFLSGSTSLLICFDTPRATFYRCQFTPDPERIPQEQAMDQLNANVDRKLPFIFSLCSENSWIAERQSKWMESLVDEFGKQGHLSFPLFSGPIDRHDLPLHPFWKKMESWNQNSGRKVLPVIDLAGPGRGCWPVLMFSLFDRILPRMQRPYVAGFIAKVAKLEENPFLMGNITTWMESIKKRTMAEEECSNLYQIKERLFGDECYQIAKTGQAIPHLESSIAKAQGESLLHRLKCLQMDVPSQFISCFSQFSKDMKDIILKDSEDRGYHLPFQQHSVPVK